MAARTRRTHAADVRERTTPRITFPNLTHLQFLVLSILGEDELSGRDLRSRLEGYGQRRSLAAFYMLMNRFEDLGIVVGRYEQGIVGNQPVTIRLYKATESSKRAREATWDFYRSLARPAQEVH